MEDSFHLLLDLAQAAQRPDLLRTVSCCIQAACCCAFACKLLRPGSTAGTPCVTPGAPAPFRSPSICAAALQIQQRLDEYCKRHRSELDDGGTSVTYRRVCLVVCIMKRASIGVLSR